jgi:MFS family permease
VTARLRGLVREPWFFWLLAGFIANQASANLLRPVVSYKALAMGVEPASLGALSAIYSLAPLAITFRIGRLVDRHGEMPFLVGGTIGMAVAGVGMALADSTLWLYVWFALLGLAQVVPVVAAQGMVARGGNESAYDRRFAAFSLSASVGQGIGPALGGLLVGAGTLGEINTALLAGALIGLLLLPSAALVRAPMGSRPAPSEGGAGTAISRLEMLRTPGILRAILVSTTILSSIDILIFYLPALGEERVWPASLVGGLLALRAVSTMGIRAVLPTLVARYGRAALLRGSMIVAAGALVAIAFVQAVPLIVILMIAMGAGLGIGQPLTMAWVASIAAPGTRATALAVRLMGNRVGQVALPVAAGTVAAFGGAAGVLGVTGVIVALSLAGVSGGLTSGPRTQPTTRGRG